MLKVKNLKKTFKKKESVVEALKGVSLSIERGEIVGLVGPNGAGKTTLIKCILGITHFDEGEITINGLPHSNSEVKKNEGYVPEEARLYTNLTGRENLLLFAELVGMNKAQAKKKIEELLEFVDLKDAGDGLVRTYSKGMTQRLSVAQALLNDPEFVILDEPMSGLDPLGRIMMIDLIKKLKDEGKTVLMSTHIIPDVEAVCGSFVLINKGEIVERGKIADFLSLTSPGYVLLFEKDGRVEREEIRGEELWGKIEEYRKEKAKILSIRQKGGGIEELFRGLKS